MEIQRVEYKNVYGVLSGKLSFSQGENFLVGINGSGKTTVLNIIRWVLGPSFPELFTVEHDLIKIDVRHQGYMYSIQSRIQAKMHELRVVTRDPSRDFQPITMPIPVVPRHTRDDSEYEARLRRRQLRWSPESDELTTWNFLIEELPSPVFIGLERSIEDRSSAQRIDPRRRDLRIPGDSTPFATATTLMRDAFNTSRRRLVEINDELNRRVLELSFSGVFRPGSAIFDRTPKVTVEKINRLKHRFEKTAGEGAYSKALSSKGVRDAFIRFLDELSALLRRKGKDEELFVTLNQHNFERAAKMFDLFERHDLEAKEVQLEITNFSEAINRFIQDSGKRVHFDNDTGTPYFTLEAGNSLQKLRLAELSSGEAQIVILLSYFAFLAKKGIPIIIDEPELSLHVEWQKNLVTAVKQVMPDDCQTIMATHSPEICGAEDVNVQSISVRAE